jgi:hypothetical protein
VSGFVRSRRSAQNQPSLETEDKRLKMEHRSLLHSNKILATALYFGFRWLARAVPMETSVDRSALRISM